MAAFGNDEMALGLQQVTRCLEVGHGRDFVLVAPQQQRRDAQRPRLPEEVVPAGDGQMLERVEDRVQRAVEAERVEDHLIPHTRTGKKLEVPVKRILQGAPVEEVVNLAAVDAPHLIDHYARLGVEHQDRSA